jgi:sugar lactone lactonase YvrE
MNGLMFLALSLARLSRTSPTRVRRHILSGRETRSALACAPVWTLVCGLLLASPARGMAQTFTLLGQKINVFAGQSGSSGYTGDGGAASSAQMNAPTGAVVDHAGNLLVVDTGNNVVRKITPAGVISTFAGTGTAGYSGNGGAATAAKLNAPLGIAIDASGNVYIADTGNNQVRKVNSAGTISNYAGNSAPGFNGDGGSATAANLLAPSGLAMDTSSNLYIADTSNYRIRMVTSGNVISTFAGTGTSGFSGDGGAATSAKIGTVKGVAVDAGNNVYLADSTNGRIRKVTGGTIATFAGTGGTDSGDGGAASSAGIGSPMKLAFDAAGNLYITEPARLRRIDAAGNITTFAGTGTAGSSGMGGAPALAQVGSLNGVAVDARGHLYAVDTTYDDAYRITLNTAFPATTVNQTSAAQSLQVVLNSASTISRPDSPTSP